MTSVLSSLVICFVLYCSTITRCADVEPLLIDKLTVDFLKLEDELWNDVLKDDYNEVDTSSNIVRKFYLFDQKLQQVPEDILLGLQVARKSEPFLFFFSDVRIIHDAYEKFRKFINKRQEQQQSQSYDRTGQDERKQISVNTLIHIILYDEKRNVNKTMQNIHEQLFGTKPELLWDVLEMTSSPHYMCNSHNQSPQQVFYNLYNRIALMQLKGNALLQFAYLAQRVQERGNHSTSAALVSKRYREVSNLTYTFLKGAMEISHRKLWRCDPKKHELGVTYDKLTRLLQAHIQNEADLNKRRSCINTCEDYLETKSYGCYDTRGEYCREYKPCHGQLLNCRMIEKHMKTCNAHHSTSRRYHYIEYKSGRVMGKKTWCQDNKAESWIRWFVRCAYCLCICDEQGPYSDRYFNLRPVTADVEHNRVVTGLRFVKRNRIIHLQIQEGRLLPYGYIDNSTVHWVPVDDYKITDADVKSGEDYHTMTYHKRSLLLDDLSPTESNYIITGVRFEYMEGSLRFQIQVSQFNFTTGVVSKDGSYYVYGSGYRNRIELENPDIPTDSPQSEPNFEPQRFVEFTHTDLDKDVGQTTVPYIDIQPVYSVPPVPLTGAGIYYKGKKGYGGFVAPEITTYDYRQHMEIVMPAQQERKDERPEEFSVRAS